MTAYAPIRLGAQPDICIQCQRPVAWHYDRRNRFISCQPRERRFKVGDGVRQQHPAPLHKRHQQGQSEGV